MSLSLVLAFTIAFLLAAFAGWVFAVGRFYRIRAAPADLERAPTADGWQLAVLHRCPSPRRFVEPVVLCHGLSTSARNFDFEPPWSLAHHLRDEGFECFSVDLRGAGLSRPPRRLSARFGSSIDDHIRLDAPALVAHALERTGARQAFWLGHSMGGLIGYAAAGNGLEPKLRGLCALGAPVFFAYAPWMRRVLDVAVLLAWPRALRQRWMSIALAPWLGRIALPMSDVVVYPEAIPPHLQRKLYANLMGSISRGVLRQLRDWIEHDAFRSIDGAIDYRAQLATLRLPALVMGGSHDRLAPPQAIRGQFERLGSIDKTVMIFGQENGDALPYGHGDLVFGAGAPREVFPRIAEWLKAHATRC